MTVSGHVFPQANQYEWGTSWAERPLLFRNVNRGKKFEVVPAVEGTGLADVIPARGAAFGDLFNDGKKLMLVINCIDHTPVLLRNVNADSNHWVGIKLIGGPKGPRDAIGATVFLSSGGLRQRGDVMSGGSFRVVRMINGFILALGNPQQLTRWRSIGPAEPLRTSNFQASIVSLSSSKVRESCRASTMA